METAAAVAMGVGGWGGGGGRYIPDELYDQYTLDNSIRVRRPAHRPGHCCDRRLGY